MTVALGTNIANPISTALSQWLGFDTMGKLANYGKLGVTDPDAVMKALFASGEQGAWYDPSDLSTMFQDSAGTTPVTADGQPVGKILDKSGRGNHASQATAAKRPLYKTAGGLHWLQFDGVDDLLSTASIDLSANSAGSVFAGISKIGAPAQPGLYLEFGTGGANANAYTFSFPRSSTVQTVGSQIRDTGGVQNERVGVTYAGSAKLVVSTLINLAAGTPNGQNTLRVNGELQGAASTLIATSGLPNFPFYIGNRSYGVNGVDGSIYSLIVLGRLATTQEITDTETWVAAKTGVTL